MSNVSLSEAQQKVAHHKKIRTGRGWILAVAIIQLLFGAGLLVMGLTSESQKDRQSVMFAAATVLVLGAIFFGCWLWAKRQPFPAALTALIIFITIHAADLVINPAGFSNGIFIKILFLVGLSQAVVSAYKLKQSGKYPA